MSLSTAHVELLERSAVPSQFAAETGVRTVERAEDLPDDLRQYAATLPGLVFPLRTVGGKVHHQFRPDKSPYPNAPKYLQAQGTGSIITVHAAMAERVGNVPRVAFVEGTKQALAAVYHAPEDTLVVGLQGCQNWRVDGVPHPDLSLLGLDKAEKAVIVFDADYRTNPNVWTAAHDLSEHLSKLGVKKVLFASIPAGKTNGLDDYLGAAFSSEQQRRAAFAAILDQAVPKLGRRPSSARKPIAGGPMRCDIERGLTLKTNEDGDEIVVMSAAGRIVRSIAVFDPDAPDAILPSLLEVEVAVPVADEDDGEPVVKTKVVTIPNDKLDDLDFLLDATHIATHVERPTSTKAQIEIANAIRRCRCEETQQQVALKRLGWMFYEEAGEWVYLHNGGAIGPTCSYPSLRGILTGRSALINFEDPHTYKLKHVREGIAATIRNIELLNDPTPWWALLGAIGLAPTGVLPKTSVSLLGEKSAGKSGLLQTATSFLSEKFGYKGAPMATADDTSNYIDLALIGHDNSFVLVDDFHPEYGKDENNSQSKTVDLILRRAHGAPSRGRSSWRNAQATQAPVSTSRPLPLMSFEKLPSVVDSGLDRTLVISVTRESTFKPDCFADFVQPGDTGYFRRAYGYYIAKLAQSINFGPSDASEIMAMYSVEKWEPRHGLEMLTGWLDWLREHKEPPGLLGRLKEAAPSATDRALRVTASLMIGVHLWMSYAEEMGVIDADNRKSLVEDGHEKLVRALVTHTATIMNDNLRQEQRVLDAIRSAIASGKATLGEPHGTAVRIGKVTEIENAEGQKVKVVAIDYNASIPGLPSGWQQLLRPIAITDSAGKLPRTLRIGPARVRCVVLPQEEAGIYEPDVAGTL